MKMHELKTTRTSGLSVNYFYITEPPDKNGNPRFRVYIIDPDANAIYETVCKTYEAFVCDHVRQFIEGAQN